ncbi:hypothetical protein [Vibrio phage VP06]|nr:hypothetical protein [Vibrio phage VP06]
MYDFKSWSHVFMWVEWNLYANGYLFLIICWSWILVSNLMSLKLKLWQALCNVVAVCLVWAFCCYVVYGTGIG